MLTHRLLSRLALVGLVLATIGCDRVTKEIAIDTLVESGPRSIAFDTVRFEYVENAGGFLGLGAGWPAEARTAVFTIGNVLLLIAMAVMAIRGQWTGLDLMGVTLFVSGGVSNVFDRLSRGAVVDFMSVGIGPLRTGIFNVADVAIMLGVGLTAVAIFRSREEARRQR